MLADTYKPHISGVTNHISLNKNFMQAAGHDVFVFTFGDLEYIEDEDNVIRSVGLPLVDTGYYVNLAYSKQARDILKTMDVLHVHHPFVSGPLAQRYGRLYGIPVIFTNHTRYDLYYKAYLPHFPEELGENILHSYMPHFCERCEMVIAPSPGMRAVLRKFGVETPVEVVPNGVDIRPFQDCTRKIERTQFGFDDTDIVLVYVGRMAPEKNLKFLLQAFAGVHAAYQKARLLLVGGGPNLERLRDGVRESGLEAAVQFAGIVPYADIPAYMHMADAFVTASVTEVHPLTVIEAMAAGLPVLGITSPGVGDIVEDSVNGFLSPNDLAAFTAKLARLVSEHELREKLSQGASETAQAYAIERTSQILLEKYQSVCAKNEKERSKLRAGFDQILDIITK
ncbi:MAG: glycosyltransferase [Anaerolineales bacterium]|nr:glycosyltransferase [Anaerolineales bacterium]